MSSLKEKGNGDEPWLGESSYGEDPLVDPWDRVEDYARQRRNQVMIRMRDGHFKDTGQGYYNDRGRAVPVRNPPRVVGRSWAFLEDFENQ